MQWSNDNDNDNDNDNALDLRPSHMSGPSCFPVESYHFTLSYLSNILGGEIQLLNSICNYIIRYLL